MWDLNYVPRRESFSPWRLLRAVWPLIGSVCSDYGIRQSHFSAWQGVPPEQAAEQMGTSTRARFNGLPASVGHACRRRRQ